MWIFRCREFRKKIEELPVTWSEAPESKTHPRGGEWERQTLELPVGATAAEDDACCAAFSCKYSLYSLAKMVVSWSSFDSEFVEDWATLGLFLDNHASCITGLEFVHLSHNKYSKGYLYPSTMSPTLTTSTTSTTTVFEIWNKSRRLRGCMGIIICN